MPRYLVACDAGGTMTDGVAVVVQSTLAAKVPVPVLTRTLMLLLESLATTRSGRRHR